MNQLKKYSLFAGFAALLINAGCTTENKGMDTTDSAAVKLITLDPGHFHAALVQKSMYEGISPTVHVYAPDGQELQAHLKLIEGYNSRAENPTNWDEKVYTGTDYLEKMLAEKPGNVVVIAGNNQKKTDYILKSVGAGLNVLADKPMAITSEGFDKLVEAFELAKKNDVLLYDIMTERYEITSILQKEFSQLPEVFGQLEKGSPDNPAITKESVHHFYKNVSGAPLVRPAWFFDADQQGEGIVDITTHMVDLIQWACFPNITLDYKKDIQIQSAKRWSTTLNKQQFEEVTKLKDFPAYLSANVKNDILSTTSNGQINYALKGVHAKVSVTWDFKAPEGTGDTHYSIIRGSKANVIIRQGKEQNYKPVLYIEQAAGLDMDAYETSLESGLKKIQAMYPGVDLKKVNKGWEVIIPDSLKVGHEDHFGQVAQKYLGFLKTRKMPDWEVANMLAKYYTTTKAREVAQTK